MNSFRVSSVFLIPVPLLLALGHLAFSGWTPPSRDLISENDQKILAVQNGLWVDAREDSLFLAEHIPGAISINRKNWEQALPKLFENYEEGKTILVYCSAGCHESSVIASKIRELGLENVQVLEGGFEAWKQSRESKSGP